MYKSLTYYFLLQLTCLSSTEDVFKSKRFKRCLKKKKILPHISIKKSFFLLRVNLRFFFKFLKIFEKLKKLIIFNLLQNNKVCTKRSDELQLLPDIKNNRFVNKMINVISLEIYCLIFSIPHITFRKH